MGAVFVLQAAFQPSQKANQSPTQLVRAPLVWIGVGLTLIQHDGF